MQHLATLSAFDFEILYKPWKVNADAVTLSRLPVYTDCNNRCSILLESIKAIWRIALPPPYIKCLAISTDALIDYLNNREPIYVILLTVKKYKLWTQTSQPAFWTFVRPGNKSKRTITDTAYIIYVKLTIIHSLDISCELATANLLLKPRISVILSVGPFRFIAILCFCFLLGFASS